MDAYRSLPLSLCSFFDQLPFSAMLIDDEGTIVYANAAALEESPGIRPIGRRLADLYPNYADALTRNFHLLGTSGVPVALAGPDGVQHQRLWSMQAGSQQCLITIREDCSIGAQTMRLASLGFMIAGVCHDIARPLSALHSMVQFLLQEATDRNTLEHALKNMALNVDHLLQISRTLGQFSRAETPNPTPVSLDAIIYDATRMLNQQHLGHAVTVRHKKNTQHVVSARPTQLRQLFLNLFTNAAQAMGGDGTIYVDSGIVDNGVEVSVRDSGPGIPSEVLPRLFDAFFTTKPMGEGIGLGLTISCEILREHGSMLNAENHPDGGAVFSFRLPLVKTNARIQ